jgi:hypothetical protein
MSRKQVIGASGALVVVGSMVFGWYPLAEVIGGGELLAVSALAVSRLSRLAMDEVRPTAMLRLEGLMTGLILIGLVGIGVMALALPG